MTVLAAVYIAERDWWGDGAEGTLVSDSCPDSLLPAMT